MGAEGKGRFECALLAVRGGNVERQAKVARGVVVGKRSWVLSKHGLR